MCLIVFDWQPEDFWVSEIFQNYYANFVKTGNPNGLGLPEWTPTTGQAVPPVLHLDVETFQTADKQLEETRLHAAYGDTAQRRSRASIQLMISISTSILRHRRTHPTESLLLRLFRLTIEAMPTESCIPSCSGQSPIKASPSLNHV